MSWKILWQLIFIVGIGAFIVMFFIFAFQGYKDIMKIIKNKNE